jgi:hypothetical protein
MKTKKMRKRNKDDENVFFRHVGPEFGEELGPGDQRF